MRQVSLKGLLEILSHEAIVLHPYKDSAGVWTIGVGHTAAAGGPDPKGMGKITIEEALRIFRNDVRKFERRVDNTISRGCRQNEFDAAVSFDFNTGGIHRATWVKLFNDGKRAEAAKAFMNWKRPPEIIPRRKRERDLFFKGEYSARHGVRVLPKVGATGTPEWGVSYQLDAEPELRKLFFPTTGPEPGETIPIPRPRPKPNAKGTWVAAIMGMLMIAAGVFWERVQAALDYIASIFGG